MRRSRLVARTTRSARIGGRCLGALFSGDSRQLALETTWAADAWEKGGEAQPNVADALGEHVRACTGGLNTESLSTAALSSKKSGRARLAVVMPRCAGGRIGERCGAVRARCGREAAETRAACAQDGTSGGTQGWARPAAPQRHAELRLHSFQAEPRSREPSLSVRASCAASSSASVKLYPSLLSFLWERGVEGGRGREGREERE
eukprot:scaffold170272_cov33-Tisochrysis_lutea.AAC.5